MSSKMSSKMFNKRTGKTIDLTRILPLEVLEEIVPTIKAAFNVNSWLQEVVLLNEERNEEKYDVYIVIQFMPDFDIGYEIIDIVNTLEKAKESVELEESRDAFNVTDYGGTVSDDNTFFIIKRSLRPSIIIDNIYSQGYEFSSDEIMYQSIGDGDDKYITIINKDDNDTKHVIAEGTSLYIIKVRTGHIRDIIFLDEEKAFLTYEQLTKTSSAPQMITIEEL